MEKKQEQKEKRKPGRPFGTLKYDNLEDLENGIDKYFQDCEAKPVLDADGNQITDKHGNPMFYPPKPPTVTGLSIALGITPQTLCNYAKDDNYFDAVHLARLRCLDYKESRLYDKDGVQGAKFDLANNSERMGGLRYADRQEYAVSAEVQPDSESIREQLKDLIGGLSEDERKALQAD